MNNELDEKPQSFVDKFLRNIKRNIDDATTEGDIVVAITELDKTLFALLQVNREDRLRLSEKVDYERFNETGDLTSNTPLKIASGVSGKLLKIEQIQLSSKFSCYVVIGAGTFTNVNYYLIPKLYFGEGDREIINFNPPFEIEPSLELWIRVFDCYANTAFDFAYNIFGYYEPVRTR